MYNIVDRILVILMLALHRVWWCIRVLFFLLITKQLYIVLKK